MSSDRSIRLSEAKKYIKHHFKKKRPVMVWGAPGIGKSEIVESIVTDYNAAGKKALLVDVRLPLWEPTDIKGIPYFDSNNTTMVWAQPSELPSQELADKYDMVVLFLDELNGAAPAVQAAAYQLILNRRVGQYFLPDNVVMVAAGNRETDKGVTYRMPKPLANRFVHYEIRVNFDDWFAWATNDGINADVVGYLTYKKAHLNAFDPKSPDRSFPTPRSWTFVSELLDDVNGVMSESEVTDMVIGAIGEGTALGFMAHRKISKNLPDPYQVLLGKVNSLKTTEISALYSLATSLAYELKAQLDEVNKSITQEELDRMIDNTIGFWLDHFEPEMVIMSLRLVLGYGIKPNAKGIKNWVNFYKRYGSLVRDV